MKLIVNSITERKAYPTVLLGTVCYAGIQRKGQVTRNQEEGEDISYLPVIAGEQRPHILSTYPGDNQLHRGSTERRQDEDQNMSKL